RDTHSSTLCPDTTRFRSPGVDRVGDGQCMGNVCTYIAGTEGQCGIVVAFCDVYACLCGLLAAFQRPVVGPVFQRYGFPFVDRLRSEEHTSELQSRENLVC